MVSETWKPVPGYEGAYEVSDLGRVRSVEHFVPRVGRWGETQSLRVPARAKTAWVAENGYLRVGLSKGGRGHRADIHRLVAAAFLGPCLDGLQVRHLNGLPTDNRLSNLQYGTVAENAADRLAHGRQPLGEAHSQHKLMAKDIPVIRARFGKESDAQIAEDYGVSDTNIRNIRTGRIWRHV